MVLKIIRNAQSLKAHPEMNPKCTLNVNESVNFKFLLGSKLSFSSDLETFSTFFGFSFLVFFSTVLYNSNVLILTQKSTTMLIRTTIQSQVIKGWEK